MRRRSLDESLADSEINISPLIDVMFILLIFFAVATVFSRKSALQIESPAATEAQQPKGGEIAVLIDKLGRYYLNSKEQKLAFIEKQLAQKAKDNPVLLIDADASANVRELVALMDAAKRAGVKDVFVLAEKQK
ncbi:MAG: biopolymer transporter ExbD [Opitutales bacterium]|nr:biopolymer transporter ExbD [Opitutales bacterium]